MNGWLQQAWEKSKSPYVRAPIMFAIMFLSVLGLTSLISDTGFAQEVHEYRVLVWIGSALIALIVAVGWLCYRNHRQLTGDKALICQLQEEITTLKAEKDRDVQKLESAFRLMEKYKAQTQEDIIARLQQLALFSIMQKQWLRKGARVERLRVEQPKSTEEYSEVKERIAVIVNLGAEDKVTAHMPFIVQDPTDSHQYGVIEIQEVHPEGATCRIVEIADVAFWSDALQAASEERPAIVEPSANVIMPASALKEIPPESAEQLLAWLQNIRRIEL